MSHFRKSARLAAHNAAMDAHDAAMPAHKHVDWSHHEGAGGAGLIAAGLVPEILIFVMALVVG